jgi:hypothetical protein
MAEEASKMRETRSLGLGHHVPGVHLGEVQVRRVDGEQPAVLARLDQPTQHRLVERLPDVRLQSGDVAI